MPGGKVGEGPDALAAPLVASAEEPTAVGWKSAPRSNGLCARLWRKRPLILYTVLWLVCSIGNTVYFKRMTSVMPNYPMLLTQITPLVFVPIFGALAGSGVFSRSKGSTVVRFAIMGALDSLAGVLMVLGGVRTSGMMQVAIQQMAIPFSVWFSMCILRKRFHWVQHVGATAMVLGIVFANGEDAPSNSSVLDNNPVFNAIFLLSMVPAALSSVYKEFAFRGHDGDLDVNLLQFWVATFQVLGNFLAMPIYSLSVLGPQQVVMSELPRFQVGGARCLLLGHSELPLQGGCGFPGEKLCDDCQEAWWTVVGFITFNLLFNIFAVLVIKHGSAALAFLLSTLRLPLTSIAFSFPALAGRDAEQPTGADVLGLGIILIGLGTYRYGGRLLRREVILTRKGSADVEAPKPQGRSLALCPVFSAGLPGAQPAFVVAPGCDQARSSERVRSDLYRRLGAASPLQSPSMRARAPPKPGSGSGSPASPSFTLSGLLLSPRPRAASG